jgi:two-component system copper resistance phosphate regulon response regulator CusR
MLPGIDGWRVIEQARDEGIGTPIIVVSAPWHRARPCPRAGRRQSDYLVKPFSMKELAPASARPGGESASGAAAR